MRTEIEPEVLAILSELVCEGDIALQYPQQLDRKLYVKLNKVLESLGGKWDRRSKGHIFANGDACGSLASAIQFGHYIDPKVAFQDFPTPLDLATELVELAMVNHKVSESVLEPSCGMGNIVKALIHYGCKKIRAIDIRPECCDAVKELGVETICGDFLTLDIKSKFSVIVMNPPFAKSQDMFHVRKAFDYLKPGGVLVSVMSPGFAFRQDLKARQFREWAEEIHSEWKPNPEKSFSSSGTNVNTITFIATKG